MTLPSGPRAAPKQSRAQQQSTGSVGCWQLLDRLAARRLPMAGVFQVKMPQALLAPKLAPLPKLAKMSQ